MPDGNYARVIELHTDNKPISGNFVDKSGNVLGKHKGIINYTVGQRKGLGISSSQPLYACEINNKTGDIILGSKEDLLSSVADVYNFNWISGKPPKKKFRCKAKIRYPQPEQSATVTSVGENSVIIVFDEPQAAITPGQAAILYDGDTVLGGGTIQKTSDF